MSYEVSPVAKIHLLARGRLRRPSWPIHIDSVDNGYIVTVGCKRFVIPTTPDLINLLDEYLNNPQELERAVISSLPVGPKESYPDRPWSSYAALVEAAQMGRGAPRGRYDEVEEQQPESTGQEMDEQEADHG